MYHYITTAPDAARPKNPPENLVPHTGVFHLCLHPTGTDVKPENVVLVMHLLDFEGDL